MTDKEFIKDRYLPQIGGKILYVGVLQNYDLHPFVKTPESFETIDIDPEVSKGMSPYKHYTGDFLDFKNEYKYDHISMHGLWGEGTLFQNKGKDNKKLPSSRLTEVIINSINKAHNMLNVGGTLQIGPNTNKINKIYDYMIDKSLYKSLFRINRNEGNCANCIFWGEKLNNDKFDFIDNDLWNRTIKTTGILKF